MKEVIKKGESIQRELPENYSLSDYAHFAPDLMGELKEIHLLTLKNTKVIQRYIYSRNIILENYVHTHGVPFLTRLKSAIKPIFYLKRKMEVDRAIWALDTWSLGYFHWFCEFLPRCISAEKYWDTHPILIPSYFLDQNYVSESLEIFPFRFLPYSINDSFKAKELKICSRQTSPTIDSEQIIKVRSYFRDFDKYQFERNKKVYVSRNKAFRRKILNEQKLIKFLKENGFLIVYMEDISFEEQRNLMSKTHFLISNHGAGLTNMMFMPDNSTIFELKANVKTINNCFFYLARALGHNYLYTLNEANHNNVQYADIKVDINKLKKVFSKYLNL